MSLHPFEPPRGRVERLSLEAPELAANLVGDPGVRDVYVYLPPGYDDAADARYPLFVDLVGFTGSGPKHLAWRAFEPSLPQRLDRLVAAGEMGPVVLALPDAFTSLGGNQYVDSVALGGWATFLTSTMIPALEARYRLRPGRAHRAVFGKSSGGFGALHHGMFYAEHWGAVACHSGDMAFDLCYQPDFPGVLDALARHDGDPAAFLDHALRGPAVAGRDFHVMMTLAMAASYDPDPGARYGVRLPVDACTCALDPERWEAWLRFDPVRCVEQPAVQRALRSLKGLFVDCGDRDQYRLHYGARQLAARLTALGIPHVYEEFPDNHSGIDYRMDRSLPWLYAALEGASEPAIASRG